MQGGIDVLGTAKLLGQQSLSSTREDEIELQILEPSLLLLLDK